MLKVSWMGWVNFQHFFGPRLVKQKKNKKDFQMRKTFFSCHGGCWNVKNINKIMCVSNSKLCFKLLIIWFDQLIQLTLFLLKPYSIYVFPSNSYNIPLAVFVSSSVLSSPVTYWPNNGNISIQSVMHCEIKERFLRLCLPFVSLNG